MIAGRGTVDLLGCARPSRSGLIRVLGAWGDLLVDQVALGKNQFVEVVGHGWWIGFLREKCSVYHVSDFSDFFFEFSGIPVLFLFVLCTLKTLKWKT